MSEGDASPVYSLVWRPQAEDDLVGIVDYIAQDAAAKALEFGRQLQQKTLLLQHNPRLGRTGRPGLPDGVRELVLHPNYILFYRLLEASATAEILRVKHASQKFP
ncbi:type II toxin-antitoxin system RelE/ParE family toxin [Xanthobacter autotrophicus]|uniref:type II toxin-antitoxin system RelE/ParE family toxin n=1 Tax=Xanthobacter autotrophicus TaxID=280 RepID=UPI00372C563E